jgi:3-phosphoshikimate 1-carboxyvinyltransferase
MGAEIQSDNFKAPLIFSPSKLNGIDYKMQIASAQVKSCILIAALNASSPTRISQPALSRDHTERMLQSMGAQIKVDNLDILIQPGPINAIDMQVPGDISSAAFWIVAALIHPLGNLTLKNVCVNKTRRGIIDILIKMGGNINLYNEKIIANEPVCDIDVKHSALNGAIIEGDLVPFLIDEIPIIIVAAALAKGETIIKDASELRVKETDRLLAMSSFLTISGVNHSLYKDGIKIIGNSELLGGSFKSFDDHRIAMSVAISSIVAKNETIIDDHEVASISYKRFWKDFNFITGSNVR